MSHVKYDNEQRERYYDTGTFIIKKGKLLDIGARTAMLRNFIDHEIDYTAVDIDIDAVEMLNIRGINAQVANAENLPFTDKSFETVVMGEVLEHIPNMGLVLQEVFRVLKDDGQLVFSVPNGEFKTRLYLALKRFYKIPFIKKCEKREPVIGGHIHMFNLKHLKVLMKSYNFVVDEYCGHKASHEYIIMRCHKYVR